MRFQFTYFGQGSTCIWYEVSCTSIWGHHMSGCLFVLLVADNDNCSLSWTPMDYDYSESHPAELHILGSSRIPFQAFFHTAGRVLQNNQHILVFIKDSYHTRWRPHKPSFGIQQGYAEPSSSWSTCSRTPWETKSVDARFPYMK